MANQLNFFNNNNIEKSYPEYRNKVLRKRRDGDSC